MVASLEAQGSATQSDRAVHSSARQTSLGIHPPLRPGPRRSTSLDVRLNRPPAHCSPPCRCRPPPRSCACFHLAPLRWTYPTHCLERWAAARSSATMTARNTSSASSPLCVALSPTCPCAQCTAPASTTRSPTSSADLSSTAMSTSPSGQPLTRLPLRVCPLCRWCPARTT